MCLNDFRWVVFVLLFFIFNCCSIVDILWSLPIVFILNSISLIIHISIIHCIMNTLLSVTVIDPRVLSNVPFFREKTNFPLPLNQEELVASYWRQNRQLILVNCLREACPGTVWSSTSN